MDGGRVTSLMTRLKRSRPGSRRANAIRAALEHILMRAIHSAGARGPDAIIAALNRNGHALRLASRVASLRIWREALDEGRRLVEISANTGREIRSTSVGYRMCLPLRLTRRQRETHALQQAFYASYQSAARKAYSEGARRPLTSRERLVVLVGELEADVNNGGFTQYLANKGRRRAGAALRRLEAIGASRAARLLRRALSMPAESTRMGALDDEFYRRPEDLAALTMRFLRRHETGSVVRAGTSASRVRRTTGPRGVIER